MSTQEALQLTMLRASTQGGQWRCMTPIGAMTKPASEQPSTPQQRAKDGFYLLIHSAKLCGPIYHQRAAQLDKPWT